MKPLTTKKLDSLIDQIYNQNCSGIQIDIMDIGKIFNVGKGAYNAAINTVPSLDAAQVTALMTTAIVGYVNSIRKN
jgi:hypothetical protein